MQKTCEKRLFYHITTVLCKKRIEKQLIFEKWEHFENGLNWPQCKGYSPCKILSLGQKIKLLKTCQKRFYKLIKVVLCKKPLEKRANIWKMRAFWKWPKSYSPCKILSLGQKIKLPKTCKKRFYKHIKVVLCKKKKGSKRRLIFKKWEHLKNFQKWPQYKGYSFCKLAVWLKNLKQKRCEKRFYDHITVGLCKKPLQKTANIREMRAFWKWLKLATMQRL